MEDIFGVINRFALLNNDRTGYDLRTMIINTFHD